MQYIPTSTSMCCDYFCGFKTFTVFIFWDFLETTEGLKGDVRGNEEQRVETCLKHAHTEGNA